MEKLVYITLLVLLPSCIKNGAGEQTGNPLADTLATAGISLQIETCTLEEMVLQEKIFCEGKANASRSQTAVVSAPMQGFIEAIYFNTGDFVQKGTLLATLSHPDYIKLQESYLENKNKLNYYSNELKRQGELSFEDATSVKRLQQAEMDFRTTEVKYLSLKAQLDLIGIRPDSIHEDGIVSIIGLHAPVSGYITEIKMSEGRLLPANDYLFEIINTNLLQLELMVPDKDLVKIKKGQEIAYKVSGSRGSVFNTQVQNKGQKILAGTSFGQVFATVDNINNQLMPGMNITAEILMEPDTVMAIPESATWKENNEQHVYVVEEEMLVKKRFTAGFAANGFVQIPFPAELEGHVMAKDIRDLNPSIRKNNSGMGSANK